VLLANIASFLRGVSRPGWVLKTIAQRINRLNRDTRHRPREPRITRQNQNFFDTLTSVPGNAADLASVPQRRITAV